jgi:hypothetical protein
MSNIGSTNTKVALAFAGMTILGTLLMVGTPGNEGVLGQITSRIAEQPSEADSENDALIAQSSVGQVTRAPAPVWDSPVIQNSDAEVPPEGPILDTPRPGFAPAPPANDADPAKAPLSPSAISTDDYDDY